MSAGTFPGIEPFFCTTNPGPEDRGPDPRQRKRGATTDCQDQATKTKTIKTCAGKGAPPETPSIGEEKDTLSKT